MDSSEKHDGTRAPERGYDVRLARRLWPFVRPHLGWFVLSLALVPTVALVSIAQPLVIMQAIDHAIAARSLSSLHRYVAMFFGLIVLYFFLEQAQILVMEYTGQRVTLALRTALFRHLQKLSMSYFTRTPVGRILTRVTNDIENLSDMFSSGLVRVVAAAFMLVGIVAAMFWLNWRLALAALAVVPPLLFIAARFRHQLRKIYRTLRTLVAHVNSYLQEQLTGMGIVQAFAREEKSYEEFTARNTAYRDVHLRSVFFESWFSAIVEAATSVALALLLWHGGLQLLDGVLTLGVLVAFIEYIHKFFEPIQDITEEYADMQNALASSEKVFDILDLEERLPEDRSPLREHAFRGEVEFRNVSFAYAPGEPVLKEVSFRVAPGEKVAVVGHTGAGKTTLMKLLNRLYDATEGAVLVDGLDVRGFDLALLRRNIGVAPQDVFLFAGSVRENIALGKDFSEERVRRAAEAVGADRFIGRLPRGYGANVGEQGVNLSAGERQLLAFARVLAHEPAVLVLDEATSSIDSETEALIQAAVPKLLRRRTSLVIAHRLATIRAVDRILVLHQGALREEGSHEALMRRRGIYWRLYRMQFGEREAPRETPALA
ncbi:MAG: ABC transporter ATP-binding protein [Acidobacteriota bacterium]|nr:MAG: ABC transporter ATP-binding protein [Acidobacteriota bacterium]